VSPPADTPEDVAALTSSQQLTHLDLAHFEPDLVVSLFPEQRQLLKLQSLFLKIVWLEDHSVLDRVITCCPNSDQGQVVWRCRIERG
jgi:hypothetical protein